MDYRFYVLNSAGKFSDVEEWNCPSDEAALEQAALRARAYGAELWQGKRKVSIFAGPMGGPGENRAA